jgi:hypothetical protein
MAVSDRHTKVGNRLPHLDGDASAEDHLRRWVGLGGLALVVVLLVTIFATPNSLSATASPAKVVTFVRDHRGGLYLNAYLTSLAVLIGSAFLWYLREVVAPTAVGRRLANLGFAGAILFVVGGIYGAGSSFAMADVAHHADPNVLQTLNIFSEDVNSFGGAATALMMGATSLAILRSKALPSWLAYVGLVLALVSFAVPFLGLPAVGLWVLITTVVILPGSRRPMVSTQRMSRSEHGDL